MKLKVMAAVLIPILVMGGWAGYYVFMGKYGDELTFKVEGYDPRDLLTGHYLRYTVNYGPKLSCSPYAQSRICVCLQQKASDPFAQASWSGACSDKPTVDCNFWLRGDCNGRFLNAGIERYNFPETLSEKVRVTPPSSSIKVRLNGRGGGIVTGFFVGGVPLLDYAKTKH